MGRTWPKKPKMALISEYLAADSSPDALAIINIGKITFSNLIIVNRTGKENRQGGEQNLHWVGPEGSNIYLTKLYTPEIGLVYHSLCGGIEVLETRKKNQDTSGKC